MEPVGSALTIVAALEYGVLPVVLMSTDKIKGFLNSIGERGDERNHKLQIEKRRQMRELANEKFK